MSTSPRTATLDPAQTLEVRTGTALPRGAVRLLTTALAGDTRRHRVVWLLRTLHLSWLLGGLDDDRARVVSVHAGDTLLGVAVAVRYDARPAPGRLVQLTLRALVLGIALELLAVIVPPPLVLAALATLASLAIIAAALLDGPEGRAGARQARSRAGDLGPDRTWGRGLVAITPSHHGQGIGSAATRALVASLPDGHRWLPVALTPQAGRLYARTAAELAAA